MRASSTVLSALCLAVTCLPADAGVFERDLIEPGDGLLTYDDINHREWFELPETDTYVSEILSQMVTGGRLEGFSFATQDDVEQLMLSAGVGLSVSSFPTTISWSRSDTRRLIDLLGVVVHATGGVLGDFTFTTGQIAVGFEIDIPLFNETNIAVVIVGEGSDLPPGSHNPESYFQPSGGYFLSSPSTFILPREFWGYGNNGPFWLYRTAVPEPSALTLLFACVLATLGHRRG